MVKHLFLVLIALGFTGGSMQAAQPGGGIIPFQSTVLRLDNGLKVIMIPITGGGLMSWYSLVRTGSRDEYEPGKTGFAHFFEHMMFRGTKNYPAAVYDSLVTEMGADANAYTTDDYTAYHLSFASEDLEMVVRLESDRFQFLEYAEAAFQTEAGAVYGEYRKNRSDPWEVLIEELQRTAFTRHTYGHTTMGYEADIVAMPSMYEYSKQFFSRYYRPENTILLLVGDFDTDDAEDMISNYYGTWARGYVAPDVQPEEAQQTERRVAATYEGRSLPLLVVSWKGEKLDPSNKHMVAGRLAGELLFGETSALYKKLVLKEQKVQSIGVSFDLNRDPGLWSVSATVKDKKDVAYVIREIDKTVEHYRKNQIERKDVDRLKKRLKYNLLMNLDTPNKIAGRLARYIAISGGIEVVDALYAAYDKVTPADIRDAINIVLTRQRRTVATLTGRK